MKFALPYKEVRCSHERKMNESILEIENVGYNFIITNYLAAARREKDIKKKRNPNNIGSVVYSARIGHNKS